MFVFGSEARADSRVTRPHVFEAERRRHQRRRFVKYAQVGAVILVIVFVFHVPRVRPDQQGPGRGLCEMDSQPMSGRQWQRIDQAVDQLARARQEFGVLATARIDRVFVVAEHPRDLVGVEAGAIDYDAGAELFALSADQGRTVSGVGAYHAGVCQDVRAVRLGDALEGFDQRLGVDDAGVRRIEREGRNDVRFEAADEFAVDDLQPLDSVLVSASLQVLKYGELIFAVGDDQLARAFVRDVVGGAEFVEHRRAAHAMRRLERPRFVVDPGVDDSAVARRGPHAQTRRRFEQEHVVVEAGDFGGNGCSDDSAADDGYVSDVRYTHCVI